MMQDRYRCAATRGEAVVREKGSRFIAVALPVRTQDELRAVVEQLAREHHGACHVCHACVLGVDGAEQRSNDDGEPSGTAGRPILQRIISAGLTYTGVAVVRYFGGTLLGRPGLIQAYGEAARLALVEAGIEEHVVRTSLHVQCTHAQFDVLKRELQGMGGVVESCSFGVVCEAVVEVPAGRRTACVERWTQRGLVVGDAPQRK
jgi:uncharacterized YigZ family protein